MKTARDMESRTSAKWEAQGWEVVSQPAGKISTELTIRRPKPKSPWLHYAGLDGVIVVLSSSYS